MDTIDESIRENSSIARTACTECQRRKQKCNREWPCNHCQKRKVADKCRFSTVLDDRTPADRRRTADYQEPSVSVQAMYYANDGEEEDDSDDDDDGVADLEALGYSAAHFLSLNSTKQEKPISMPKQQYFREPSECSQLDHVLQVLPPRPYADALIRNFVDNVNFHYYVIHRQTFLQEYDQWWIDRYENKPLGLPWTALLLMVCACSSQHPTADMTERLQADLGQPIQKLSEKYHSAGRELYHAIPVGNAHLYTVQQLLHSCYWFKTEGRHVECWHGLTTAIREAQELGIHQESIVIPPSEYEREMRRRAWCLLSVWDWQVGSLLSRPLILHPEECDVNLPGLSLPEEISPSPVLFLRLQFEIIGELSRLFGRPSNADTVQKAEQFRSTVERWIERMPQPFNLDDPDRSMDVQYPWIALHRHEICTISLSMVLDPVRVYLVKSLSRKSPPGELSLRRYGVRYATLLIARLLEFFSFAYPGNVIFRSVIFSIFDTAALLCSAVIHDSDHSLPGREECLKAIESSLELLKSLQTRVSSAKKPYEMLSRLSKKLTKQSSSSDSHTRKRPRGPNTGSGTVPQTQSSPASQPSPISQPSPASYPSPASHNSPGAHSSPGSYNYVPPSRHSSPGASMSLPTGSYPAINHQMPSMMQPGGGWAGGIPIMQPGHPSSSQYHVAGPGSGFIPSPSSATSGVDGSFTLSTSPSGPMNAAPVVTSTVYPGMMMAPQGQYQDFHFGHITEDDLGTLAGMWDYSSLNLDHVPPQHSDP